MTQFVHTTHPVKPYPGMLCDSVEFFLHEDSFKALQSGTVKDFNELGYSTIGILEEAIVADPQVADALMELHPHSNMMRIEQFAKCRFGGLDFHGDIRNGILQDGEYWPCPKRGSCAYEGTLCKLPTFKGERLTQQEILLMQLTSTDKTNDAIASELDVPLGTLHKIKNHLYKKLGDIQTKQEVAVIASFLNLI